MGSPPRMRGKGNLAESSFVIPGITPAYAGKSHEPGTLLAVVRGSPPRMRGKVTDHLRVGTGKRITPAYAGKSMCQRSWSARRWDHPRVCGEKCRPGDTTNSLKGSPPRMRGKDRAGKEPHPSRGITPAYAGKRRKEESPGNRAKDHPRVCGEKILRVEKKIVVGSPPRMRGKDEKLKGDLDYTRITPAYAGKSRARGKISAPCGDHPRVCGEKEFRITKIGLRVGSPPRMRGKVAVDNMAAKEQGITPAYAGKRAHSSEPYIEI